MYAAQWFAAIRRLWPDLDERVARGQLEPVFTWLRENIWSQGSRWSVAELATKATGEALNPLHFRRHLEARYLP
jgi:carboxypeptidase Taq